MSRIRGSEQLLAERGEISGRFAPAHAGPDHPGDPGLLRWDPQEGATLTLITPTSDLWPKDAGGTGEIVHGISHEGEPLTLIGAWPARITMMRSEITLHASEIVLDGQITPEDRWSKLTIETAHLHEWLPRTGLTRPTRKHGPDFWTTELTVGWEQPESTTIDIGTAKMTIGPWMDSDVDTSPDAAIKTGLAILFEPRRRRTKDDLRTRYAIPFVALMMLAADRPDATTREILRGGDSADRVIVQHAGDPIPARPWRLGRDYLFRAKDLADLERSLRAWYRLWDRVGNALAVFGDAVLDDNKFTRGRFLSVFTALEAYERVVIGARGDGDRKLKGLRSRGGVDSAITGCTNPKLVLIVATRNWFAHLGNISPHITPEIIQDEMLDTTRRATALLQACLLRDLGIPKAQRNELMERHYRNWRIPS